MPPLVFAVESKMLSIKDLAKIFAASRHIHQPGADRSKWRSGKRLLQACLPHQLALPEGRIC